MKLCEWHIWVEWVKAIYSDTFSNYGKNSNINKAMSVRIGFSWSVMPLSVGVEKLKVKVDADLRDIPNTVWLQHDILLNVDVD